MRLRRRVRIVSPPEPRPDTDLHREARAGKDAFVRVLSVDHSAPPAFAGRRIGVRVRPATVRPSCEGTELAVHARSSLPGRRRPRTGRRAGGPPRPEAANRLRDEDPELPAIDLAR